MLRLPLLLSLSLCLPLVSAQGAWQAQAQGQALEKGQGDGEGEGERRAGWEVHAMDTVTQGQGQGERWGYREETEEETSRIGAQDIVTQGTQDTVTQATQDAVTQDTQDSVTQDTRDTATQDTGGQDIMTRPTLPHTSVTQGSYFETHMQRVLGVSEHSELHRRIHEAARKVQEEGRPSQPPGQGPRSTCGGDSPWKGSGPRRGAAWQS